MRLPFGFELRRKEAPRSLSGVDTHGTWWPIVADISPGAWQRNVHVNRDSVLAQTTVYACITQIARDIGKLRIKLVEHDDTAGIWRETSSPAFSPVLHKPNRFQTRQKFVEGWIGSKLAHGNAVVLKERDGRGVVVALYLLDWRRVTPLVADDGEVFYQLRSDNLAGISDEQVTVPASKIIHDRMECLFHPLVGISPIFACGLAATQGLKIQTNSATFFDNMSRPSGILTAPAAISDATAARLKEHWEANYKAGTSGKVAVLGDGLKYEPMTITAVDSQLVEQLKLSAEQVCTAFHVPAWMVGVGPLPPYGNGDALLQVYHAQCLQSLIKALQTCLAEGLGLDGVPGRTLGVHLDLDELLLMDTPTRIKTTSEAIGGGWLAPNEGRAKFGLPPAEGGSTPFLQEQNWPIQHLAAREIPQRPPTPPADAPAANDPRADDDADEEAVRAVARAAATKALADMRRTATA